MELAQIRLPQDFRFSMLLLAEPSPPPFASEQAFRDLVAACDDLWPQMPPAFQDLLLRAFRSGGANVNYPPLPSWVLKAMLHFFTIHFPTLRKSKPGQAVIADWGRLLGHLMAIIAHGLHGTGILAGDSIEIRSWCARVEQPVRHLIGVGLALPPVQATEFLKGFENAYSSTFDKAGLPMGWNTNSPVIIVLCFVWRAMDLKSMSLPQVRAGLVKVIGESLVGTEDRLKKIFKRLGRHFPKKRPKFCQGTSGFPAVPSAVETTSDKKRVGPITEANSHEK